MPLPSERFWLQPAVVRKIEAPHRPKTTLAEPDRRPLFADPADRDAFGDLLTIDHEAKLDDDGDERDRNGIDVLALARNGDAVVFELKRDGCEDALPQAVRYATGISGWRLPQFARQRARKFSYGRPLADVEREILDFLRCGEEGINRRRVIHLVARKFGADTSACAATLADRHGLGSVSLWRYEFTPQGVPLLEVELVKPRDRVGRTLPEGEMLRRCMYAASCAPMPQLRFPLWHEDLLPRLDPGFIAAVRRHLEEGADNSSSKPDGGHIYFDYTPGRTDGFGFWTYLHDARIEPGRIVVARRVDMVAGNGFGTLAPGGTFRTIVKGHAFDLPGLPTAVPFTVERKRTAYEVRRDVGKPRGFSGRRVGAVNWSAAPMYYEVALALGSPLSATMPHGSPRTP